MKLIDHGDDAEIDIDPEIFERILVEAIMNAIAHSPANTVVDVYAEKEYIKVYNDPSEACHFRIMNGRLINGKVPAKSTTATGSGKGLTHMLSTARASGLDVCMEANRHQVATTIRFPHDEPGQILEATEAEPRLPFPNVIFICHQNIPEQTFGKLISQMPPGFNVCVMRPPSSLSDMSQFLRENATILDKASLCIMHISELETALAEVFQPMYTEFPHISFLPASHGEMRHLSTLLECHEFEVKAGGGVEHPEIVNLILPEDMTDFTRGRIVQMDGLNYAKCYSPEYWTLILEYAQTKAVGRKRSLQGSGI